jgi:hypothetical protein
LFVLVLKGHIGYEGVLRSPRRVSPHGQTTTLSNIFEQSCIRVAYRSKGEIQMSLLCSPRLSLLITLLASVLSPILLNAQEPYRFYTSYTFSPYKYQNLQWTLCGRNGCFVSGNLGPFGKADALIEGNPSVVDAGTITHAIYVVDTEGGHGTGVTLYVYKETIIVKDPGASTVTLLTTVPLKLTGGGSAICSMAGNDKFLFIGTNQTKHALRVRKSDLTVTNAGEWGLGANVSSMSSDKRGYITINFGAGGSNFGNIQYAPDGYFLGYSGPEFEFLLNTNIAVSAETFAP